VPICVVKPIVVLIVEIFIELYIWVLESKEFIIAAPLQLEKENDE